jgi:hypothetical protein
MKKLSGRPQDLLDIASLTESLGSGLDGERRKIYKQKGHSQVH